MPGVNPAVLDFPVPPEGRRGGHERRARALNTPSQARHQVSEGGGPPEELGDWAALWEDNHTNRKHVCECACECARDEVMFHPKAWNERQAGPQPSQGSAGPTRTALGGGYQNERV